MGLSRPQFRALFEREKETVFRFLVRLCRHRADAEDLLQQTFLTVWRKRAQFEGRGSPAGYVRKTAYRQYLNARERKERRVRLLRDRAPEPPPVDPAVDPAEAFPGGDTTSFFLFAGREFAQPAANLEDRAPFFTGDSLFNQAWVTAPASTTASSGTAAGAAVS